MSSSPYDDSDVSYSDDDSYHPPPPPSSAPPGPPLESTSEDDATSVTSSSVATPGIAKRSMLGSSGRKMSFKNAGKMVAMLKAEEHNNDMRREQRASKTMHTAIEGTLKMYTKGGYFGKSKFVSKWVRLKASSARVSVEYYKTDKRPKEGELPKNIVKLDPPGLRINDLDQKVLKAAGKNSHLCFQCTVASKDTTLAFLTESYATHEEWTKKIEFCVEEMLQSLRSQSGALPAGGSNNKDLEPHDDNESDDASSVFTDTYTNSTATETNTMSDTYTQASSSKNKGMTSPNVTNIPVSKRLNFAAEGKKQETSDAYLQSQKATTPDPQAKRSNAVPNRVAVDYFESKFTDAGLATSKAGLERLISRAKAEIDPQNVGHVSQVDFERFCHLIYGEIEQQNLSMRTQPPIKTNTEHKIKAAITKHIDSHHFERAGIKWDARHASKYANDEDRTRYGMSLKRSNLVATIARNEATTKDPYGPENSMTPANVIALPTGNSSNVIEKSLAEDDWNVQYQAALKMPEKRYAEAIKKGLRVHHLQRKVNKIAVLAARTIVEEYALPPSLKSIPPLDLEGGDATGEEGEAGEGIDGAATPELMYVYRNFLIRLIKPGSGLGGDEEDAMYKIAGNELRGMKAMQTAATKAYQKALLLNAFDPSTQPLALVLSVLVDYHGFRFLVMSMPPVDEERTQVYGRRDTHDPNSRFLDNDAMFHGLHSAACDELNLKPHNVISDGEAKLIHGSVETQGHYCHDGCYYAMNFSRLMPSDLPNDGLEMLTKQLRPELVSTYRMPLSSDAFSNLTAPPKDDASASLVSDSDQADVEVGGASRFLLTERIPNFVEQLDLMKTFPYDSSTFTQAVHAAGINIRHIGRIAELTRLPHVREMVVIEMLARTGKLILNRGHRRVIHKAKEAADLVILEKKRDTGTTKRGKELKENLLAYNERLNHDNIVHIVDFLNLMVGAPNDRENDDFWKHVLLPTLAKKFNYHHSGATDPLKIDRIHICPMQLYHALQYHCGIRCTTSENYDFDGEAFPIKIQNVLSTEAKCKYMQNDGLDINIVASMAETERERKRYLIALQGFRIRLFTLNNTSGLAVDLEAARTYNQMADMYCLDYLEEFSKNPQSNKNSDEANYAIANGNAAATSGEGEKDALDIALDHSDKALALVPSTHALSCRIHETRMKIYYHKNDSGRMMQEFVAGIRAAVSHFGMAGNHPFVCELHCVLGALFKKMGNINGAKDHLLKARDLAVKILGGSHTLLASYATQLGHVFSQSGDIDQAIVHHLQGLQIHEASFGANSLEAANNAFYLGECYAERGNMPKAAELAKRALEVRERALKEKKIQADNDDLLSSYYQMASMCVQNSEHGHAAHYYELVLQGLRKSSVQSETVLREIQRVTRDILNLRILTLTPIVMRQLQVIVNKHRPDKLLLAISGNSQHGSYDLMASMKEVIEKVSVASPSQFIEALLQDANLSPETGVSSESRTPDEMETALNAEKCLACIVALTEQSQTS